MERDKDFLANYGKGRKRQKRKRKRLGNGILFGDIQALIQYFKKRDWMNLNDIKEELKGYFIYKNGTQYELGFKQGEDFKLIVDNIAYLGFKDTFTLTPIRYLLMQVNNNLLDPSIYVKDLADVIPVIDFQVFQDYDKRTLEINRHNDLLDKITGSKSIFNRKKDFKLIYVKNHNHLLQDKEQVGYYVIKGKEVVPIDSALLDDDYMANAVEVKDIDLVRNALRDSLVNQYKAAYLQEVNKYQNI